MPDRMTVLGVSLLPRAGEPAVGTTTAAAPHQPRTAVEQAMVEIWRQVLPSGAISPESDFFDLGGDSLLATQIAARARQVFGLGLDLMELLDQPTPAAMAAQVEAALRQGAPAPSAPTPALAKRAGASVIPVKRGRPLPLSFTQERMWFIQQLDPLSAAYNLAGAVRLRGELDLAAMEAAFSQVVRRHESLRTTFVLVDGEPRQCPAAPEPFHVQVVEVDGPASDALALAGQAAQQPFDLARGPLLRATIYQLSSDDQVLLLSIHHIISDAWSLAVLGREVMALYQAARQGTPAALPDLPIQYADFAAWQRATLQGEALERELAYWRQKLDGVIRLELPVDFQRPNAQRYHGALEGAAADPAVLRQLRQLSQQAGATLSMTLLTAFQVLLHRYTGQDDVAVGLSIANRRDVAVEGLIGAFVNTLVLRTDLSGRPENGPLTFREALARVRQSSLEAYAHQDMPFARLVAELNPERNLSHTPLVQVMFNHINVPIPAAPMDGLESEYMELDRGAAQFDLTLTVFDPGQTGARERLIMEYNTELFAPATARRMLKHYANLLRAIAADPNQSINALPLLDDAERRQVLVEWNDNARPYPDHSLAEMFEAQAARTPDAPALILGEQSLSYRALNLRANQIAHYLQALGVGPGAFVGVCLERSFDQFAALLAALKAGAAYVPLDPAYPADRLRYMLADCGAAVVVTEDLTPRPPFPVHSVPGISDLSRKSTGTFGGKGVPLDHSELVTTANWNGVPADHGGRVMTARPEPGGQVIEVALDAIEERLAEQAETNLGLRVPIDAPAYVIYTSESTGRPKGVVAPHRGALNHCQWVWDTYPFAPGEVA